LLEENKPDTFFGGRMARFYFFVLATALAAMAIAADAQNRRPAYVAMNGVGAHSCGKYIESRKSSDEIMTLLYQQWAAGYLAGYSDAITKPGMSTNLVADLETYTAWLDKWCADDPASNVSAGLVVLRLRLIHTE
jgi:hypothetical protein